MEENKVNQPEFINMGLIGRDFAYNVATWGGREDCNGLFVWFAGIFTKR